MNIIDFCNIKLILSKKMCEIEETLKAADAAKIYSKYVCRMNGWLIYIGSCYSNNFIETSFAFMAGYIKSMRDNGFKFTKGMVSPIDPERDIPLGGKDYYDADMRKKYMEEAIDAFSNILRRYESSEQNVAVIMDAFKNEIDKLND